MGDKKDKVNKGSRPKIKPIQEWTPDEYAEEIANTQEDRKGQ